MVEAVLVILFLGAIAFFTLLVAGEVRTRRVLRERDRHRELVRVTTEVVRNSIESLTPPEKTPEEIAAEEAARKAKEEAPPKLSEQDEAIPRILLEIEENARTHPIDFSRAVRYVMSGQTVPKNPGGLQIEGLLGQSGPPASSPGPAAARPTQTDDNPASSSPSEGASAELATTSAT